MCRSCACVMENGQRVTEGNLNYTRHEETYFSAALSSTPCVACLPRSALRPLRTSVRYTNLFGTYKSHDHVNVSRSSRSRVARFKCRTPLGSSYRVILNADEHLAGRSFEINSVIVTDFRDIIYCWIVTEILSCFQPTHTC